MCKPIFSLIGNQFTNMRKSAMCTAHRGAKFFFNPLGNPGNAPAHRGKNQPQQLQAQPAQLAQQPQSADHLILCRTSYPIKKVP